MEFIKSYPEEIETLKKIDDKVRFEGRVSHDEALKRIKKYVGDETFMLTYGDGLCDVNIRDLLEFHKMHGLQLL